VQAVKNVGMAVLGLGLMIGLGIIASLYLYGIAWVSVRDFDYVLIVNSATFFISFFIFLPCAVFRATRKFAAAGLVCASYVFGLTVWILGLLVTYAAWGLIGVFMGLILVGVGVVPLGVIASGLHGQWDMVWQLVLGIALTWGARGLAMWLAIKIDQETSAVTARADTISTPYAADGIETASLTGHTEGINE
jgi:hypothetical protein